MRFQLSRETMVALGVVALLGAAIISRSRQAVHDKSDACCESLSARELAEPLPGDSTMQSGTLGNGLHYYVQENESPKGRAELRLAVNAGSVLERDDQRGLAHAVEHMVFRGTAKFPGRAIDSYFLSTGMRLGQDLNAYTSRDQTVYSITVPTDRAGALDTAVAILAQMAFAATFDSVEARTESGIVLEEWRSSRGSGARLAEQRDGLLLAGSQYAARLPIGDTAIIRKFDVQQLRKFYDEWYRPDLMALSVVGDFNANDVRQLVSKSILARCVPDRARHRDHSFPLQFPVWRVPQCLATPRQPIRVFHCGFLALPPASPPLATTKSCCSPRCGSRYSPSDSKTSRSCPVRRCSPPASTRVRWCVRCRPML